jgi:MFS family permease
MVGPLSSKFGRKHGLWAAAILNGIATAVQIGTTSKAALYVARLILGNYTPPKLYLVSNTCS